MNAQLASSAAQPDLNDRVAAILASPTYRLAEDDTEFMEGETARASRLSLEFMRADTYLREQRIRSTVVVFGGSRILDPQTARAQLEAAKSAAKDADPEAHDASQTRLALAEAALSQSRWYEQARLLGAELGRAGMHPHGHEFVVATGGGPGIMEAANHGAFDVGAPTVGFNIRLPEDQPPNAYITPTLAFRFHYFALRKMHFVLRARALVAFPGGYGTLDELFNSLNLVQTRVIAPMPIVLVGREHWSRVIDFDFLMAEGLIDARDRRLFEVVDSGLEAARHICCYHAAT